MTDASRRAVLADAATDYALRHGLIGLSLRPLAAAAGTSDRMLLYHFRDKDDLVATILRTSNDRAVATLEQRPAVDGVAATVRDLWTAVTSPGLDECERVYVEAAALGLLGREPYVAVVREANERWIGAVAARLSASGVPGAVVRRLTLLVDATFMGLQLDQQIDDDATEREQAVADLADAVAAVAASAGGDEGRVAQGRA